MSTPPPLPSPPPWPQRPSGAYPGPAYPGPAYPSPAPVPAPVPAPAWGQRPQWAGLAGIRTGTAGGAEPAPGDRLDTAWLRVAGQRGAVPLRPLGLVELLDSAFATVRTNPVLMIGTGAIVGGAMAVLEALPRLVVIATGGHGDPVADGFGAHEFVAALAGFVLDTLGVVLAATITACLLAPVALDAALGRRTSGPALRALWRSRLPGILAATLLVAGYVAVGLGPATLGFAMVSGGRSADGALVVSLGLLVWLPAWMALAAGRLVPALPILLGENVTVRRALARSRTLTKGSFWRLAWLQVVAWTMTFLAALTLTMATDMAADAVGNPDDPTLSAARATAAEAIATLGNVGALAVLLPFLACLLALVHLDLRLRREGLAVRLLRDLARRDGVRAGGASSAEATR